MDVKIWFYDDREYYNYVLLNASEDIYSSIKKALISDGIKVLKAAPSFRPASNGTQYKWYIRIEGDNFKSPTLEKIKSIVDGILALSIQTPHEQSQSLLQEKINSLTAKTSELQKEIDRKNKEIESIKRLSEIEIKSLLSNLKTVEADLQQSKQTTNELSEQIKNSLNLNDVAILENQFKSQITNIESQLRNAKSELNNSKSELKEYLDGFQNDINERDIKIETLTQERDKYAEVSQKTDKQLLVQEKNSMRSLFLSTTEVLLPHVDFLRDSLDFLLYYSNFSNEEINAILRAITIMDSPKSPFWAVKQDKRWKEYHPERQDWRVYYMKCSNEKYKVLISDKKTQDKRDWDYIKSQKNC